jgi:predicted nuclease of predicted toxin-antitoxin system
MAKITLLLDEDVRPMLGEILRQRGYDAVHTSHWGPGLAIQHSI